MRGEVPAYTPSPDGSAGSTADPCALRAWHIGFRSQGLNRDCWACLQQQGLEAGEAGADAQVDLLARVDGARVVLVGRHLGPRKA